jgi:hypothetical protein
VPDPDSALKLLFNPGFDYAGTVIIDGEPRQSFNLPDSASLASESIEFLDAPPDRIRIRANLSTPGLLAIQDNWYPHWRAYEGEVRHRIFRSDYTFMAVELSEGVHELEFRLENPNYMVARAVSGVSWVIMVIGLTAAGIIRLRSRRGEDAGDSRRA